MKIRYSSYPVNFGGLSEDLSSLEKSKVVVVPVPYDATASYGKGSSEGPARIIDASRYLELYDEELKVETCKIGIHTLAPIEPIVKSPFDMVLRVEQISDQILSAGKFPVMLGGDHILSVGAIRALIKKYPDLWCVQLDAHADLRDEYEGSPYSHACTAKRIAEICPVWQIGVRSLSKEEFACRTTHQVVSVFATDFFNSCAWRSDVNNLLGENVYITIDADVFDPSQMPAVGTPEPGGLRWHDVLEILKFICSEKNVVGFDVVEFVPIDGQRAWEFTLAKLVYKLLGYKFFIRGAESNVT